MKDPQIAELEQELLFHQLHLRKFCGSAERMQDGSHIFVAGQLRVLLCDTKLPLLLKYIDMKRLTLIVSAPAPPIGKWRKALVVSMTKFAISRKSFPGSCELTIQDFLEHWIETVPKIGGKWEDGGTEVTAKSLIKWVANKDGSAHFDPKKPLALQAMKKSGLQFADGRKIDEWLVKDKLFQIGAWAAEIIDVVILAKAGSTVK